MSKKMKMNQMNQMKKMKKPSFLPSSKADVTTAANTNKGLLTVVKE